MIARAKERRLRSRDWFDDPERIDVGPLYLEPFMNFGLTAEERRSGRPIVGIAQSGSDINPCNRIHLGLARRVRDGIRDASGNRFDFAIRKTNVFSGEFRRRFLCRSGQQAVFEGRPVVMCHGAGS